MRVVIILVVLVVALFLHIARWLKPFIPVDLRTEYGPYVLEIVEPTDAEEIQVPTTTVD